MRQVSYLNVAVHKDGEKGGKNLTKSPPVYLSQYQCSFD
jgi:hypothetical protein